MILIFTVSLKLLNLSFRYSNFFEHQHYSDDPYLFGSDSIVITVWLVVFDLIMLNILCQTVAYAASVCKKAEMLICS
jgi:hypothetical protein